MSYELYKQLTNNTHALIAGTTGSGKSVLLNNLICYSLEYQYQYTNYVFIDPKVCELSQYKNIGHCVGYADNITAINRLLSALIVEMEKRYRYMSKKGLRKYDGAQILVFIDEIADIFTSYGKQSKEAKQKITTLLAKARASKIYLIVCTQAPNRKIIPAEIVLNIPTRCALRCLSAIESRQIINEAGAENLPKYGSCLLLSPDYMQIKRFNFPLTPDSIQQQAIANHTPKKSILNKIKSIIN